MVGVREELVIGYRGCQGHLSSANDFKHPSSLVRGERRAVPEIRRILVRR